MRRVPKTVQINGERWRVVVKPLRKAYGFCVYKRRQIQIDANLPMEEQAEVLLHELMHACLPEQSWSARTEEQMIVRMAPRLLAALQSIGWVK